MKPLLYIALVVVLTAPLIWAWNPIRKWLGPEIDMKVLLLRILALTVAFVAYALLAFWLTITLMGLVVVGD